MDKEKAVKIENWSIVSRSSPYTAPEARVICLQGEAFEHPSLGTRPVTTSRLVEVDGLFVKTFSGSVYLLGQPDKEYLSWMAQNNIKFDPANPIRTKMEDSTCR